ncbi:MAG TPA: succinate--CoA ligase subunit alpha [Ardenticatenaceae bacterium]|jgi:succinyl-CoA synthetase alpha subunit
MSVFVDKNTKVVVSGITGREASFHTPLMLEYGTQVVAGVTPGKGGQEAFGVPVFNTVKEAVEQAGANTSLIFVPAPYAADAMLEAANSGIRLVICISEGVPVQDMLPVKRYMDTEGIKLLGPNCPGMLTPNQAKVGIIPGSIAKPGPVGIVSRSGTLTYEVSYELLQRDIGVTTIVGIGGDPVPGMNFIDVLKAFQADDETEAIVLIGEIGGTDEENAARYIQENVTKPVFAFIAGRSAPPGRRMGHAGAIISGGGEGTAESKIQALQAAGARVGNHPGEVAEFVAEHLSR